MCLLVVCKERSMSDAEVLSAWQGNKDGVGIAWQEGGRNHYVKGLMTLEALRLAYAKVPLPHVIHFRLATSGYVCEELTHPFIVAQTAPTPEVYEGRRALLFHNGIVSGWQKVYDTIKAQLPNDLLWSDTRLMAYLTAKHGYQFVQQGVGGKYVVLNHGIKMYGEFYEDKGIWRSTRAWKYEGYGGDYYTGGTPPRQAAYDYWLAHRTYPVGALDDMCDDPDGWGDISPVRRGGTTGAPLESGYREHPCLTCATPECTGNGCDFYADYP